MERDDCCTYKVIHLDAIVSVISNGKGWVVCKHGYDRQGVNKQNRGREKH